MGFPNVQRKHRADCRCGESVRAAPVIAAEIHECCRCRAQERGDGAAPEVEILRPHLIQRGPLTMDGADDEPQTCGRKLNVEVERWVIEEVRIQVTGVHHADGVRHDDRFIRSRRVRNSGRQTPEAEPCAGGEQHDKHRVVGGDTQAPERGFGHSARRRQAPRNRACRSVRAYGQQVWFGDGRTQSASGGLRSQGEPHPTRRWIIHGGAQKPADSAICHMLVSSCVGCVPSGRL